MPGLVRIVVLLAGVVAAVPTATWAQSSPKKRAGVLGSPREDEESTRKAGRTADPKAASEADTALVRALLYAVEPAPQEIRIQAVEDLALLGDSRALNMLAQLVFDANPAVQLASVRAVSHFQTPRAEEILCNVVRHPQVPELVKVRALEGLPFQRTSTAREMLEEVSRQPRYNPRVQAAAKLSLEELAGETGASR